MVPSGVVKFRPVYVVAAAYNFAVFVEATRDTTKKVSAKAVFKVFGCVLPFACRAFAAVTCVGPLPAQASMHLRLHSAAPQEWRVVREAVVCLVVQS